MVIIIAMHTIIQCQKGRIMASIYDQNHSLKPLAHARGLRQSFCVCVCVCVCVCACVCVCLSVCNRASCYMKTLCSKVLARFADHLCLLRFLNSRRTKETVMASIREDQQVELTIGLITRLTHHRFTVDYQQSLLAFFVKLLIRHVHDCRYAVMLYIT